MSSGAEHLARVRIERLGSRGEGVASLGGSRIYVPYALPGESVTIDRESGERATLIGIAEPSGERIAAICPYFTTCGGCAVQTLAPEPYAAWKRGLLVEALSRASIPAEVEALVDAHGLGRRRATFHARTGPDGRTRVGFMQARAHTIVPIEYCPILDPALAGALPAARAIAEALASGRPDRTPKDGGKPLDILVTAADGGLDIDLRGHGKLSDDERARLTETALAHKLARLSNHGTIVVERQAPTLAIGAARVPLPPGTFLQATAAGEAALAERVLAALPGARMVADLFCGIGTFALRIAAGAEVFACDSEGAPLVALDRAARATPALRRITTETRDLFRRPLGPEELKRFDAVVLDPPRAGAEAQMRALAASTVRRVVSVSCDAQSFARDASILVAAGFVPGPVMPIDQFRYAPHLEMVAVFERAAPKKKRRLLG